MKADGAIDKYKARLVVKGYKNEKALIILILIHLLLELHLEGC